ncbi:MAG: 3-oxoacyl-[acyl-carrier-protein] reductase [candidate division Zixibacteria bacterium RBG_16_48_11]|nr:MAG: 3-oxoacyl-[acyl-carrier-protein] reductase [candidate division Zixibacteria bacterium RBG_16_48_11]
MSLQGKLAVVTGASKGIGEAIARRLFRDGATIVLVAHRNLEAALKIAQELDPTGQRTLALQADVADSEQVAKLVGETLQKFQRIDILINNAGLTKDNVLVRMSEQDWDAVIDTNLKGAFNCIKAVARGMMKNRNGKIVNVSSVVGLMGNPGQANYCASKAGLIGLTKSAAKELASRNITVNAIAPGFIDTEMTKVLSDQAKNAMLSLVPLHKAGTPQDVASLVSFLVSDQASYITGQVIRIDGGLLM